MNETRAAAAKSVLDDLLGGAGEVNAATADRAVSAAIAESGLNPEQITDRIEWAIREAYIRGTSDGYAKGVREFALIWPLTASAS